MSTSRFPSMGLIKTIAVVAVLAVVASMTAYSFLGGGNDQPISEHELTFVAVQKPFISSIIESGDVASSSNVDIRCKVRERGGTAILEIVPKALWSRKVICWSSWKTPRFGTKWWNAKFRVAQDRASVIQAQSNLTAAQRSLTEFQNGQFLQELATYEAEYAFAQETLRRAREYKQLQ